MSSMRGRMFGLDDWAIGPEAKLDATSPQSSPKPVGVWDVTQSSNCLSAWWFSLAANLAWARKFIPRPEHTYRIEFYLMDTAYAEVYRYAENGKGFVFVDVNTGEVVLDAPERLFLTELPKPQQLRGCAMAGSWAGISKARQNGGKKYCPRYGWNQPGTPGWPSFCGIVGGHGTIEYTGNGIPNGSPGRIPPAPY